MRAGSPRAAPGGAPAGRRRSLAAMGSLSTALSLPPPGAACPREVWAAWQSACRAHGTPLESSLISSPRESSSLASDSRMAITLNYN